jgi:hypothetical protein
MRDLTTKEQNLIETLWTAVEQWDACDGMGEGLYKKCEDCPFWIFRYDVMHEDDFYHCFKMLIEQMHEKVCT